MSLRLINEKFNVTFSDDVGYNQIHSPSSSLDDPGTEQAELKVERKNFSKWRALCEAIFDLGTILFLRIIS